MILEENATVRIASASRPIEELKQVCCKLLPGGRRALSLILLSVCVQREDRVVTVGLAVAEAVDSGGKRVAAGVAAGGQVVGAMIHT